jgi:hypothetical protein
MILALGPWRIAAEKKRELIIPFSESAKPKLIMNMTAVRQIRFLTCNIQGDFFLDRFVLDGEKMISGRCTCPSFMALFPTMRWPLVGPGSKLEVSVYNPSYEDQIFSLAFTVKSFSTGTYE